MKRPRLFELEDQSCLPASIRDAGTDFLRFMLESSKVYRPIIPDLKAALARSESEEILDLCSGGAGPVVGIYKGLAEGGYPIRITLTDKYPNHVAFKHVQEQCGGGVNFLKDSVDATEVSPHLSGFRTLFTSLHHFPEVSSKSV